MTCRLFRWFHWGSAVLFGVSAVGFGRWFSQGVQPVEADLVEHWAQAAANSCAVKYMGADKSQIGSMRGDGYKMMRPSDALTEAIHSGQCSQFKNSR